MFSNVSKFQYNTKPCSKYGFHKFLPYIKSNFLVKGVSFWSSVACAIAIPDLISHVHLASFVIMLTNSTKFNGT